MEIAWVVGLEAAAVGNLFSLHQIHPSYVEYQVYSCFLLRSLPSIRSQSLSSSTCHDVEVVLPSISLMKIMNPIQSRGRRAIMTI